MLLSGFGFYCTSEFWKLKPTSRYDFISCPLFAFLTLGAVASELQYAVLDPEMGYVSRSVC
jgi:hypothetical protein